MKAQSTQMGQNAGPRARVAGCEGGSREIVKNRLVNVLRLIRKNGNPQEAIVAAQWEEAILKGFDPVKELEPLKAA